MSRKLRTERPHDPFRTRFDGDNHNPRFDLVWDHAARCADQKKKGGGRGEGREWRKSMPT